MKHHAVCNSAFLCQRRYEEERETGFCARGDFQRDRDRILHSRAFRRMMHKTQVFNANMGDHYRNRLTHTLEVSQIARSIGKVLELDDELIEAIALGHDLGHTPFGHTGERVLHEILMNGAVSKETKICQGFKHNFQSLRVVDELESRCNSYSGLNLTLAVREGMLKHTKVTQKGSPVIFPEGDFNNMNLGVPSFTFEGQVVAIADEIAQCTHDLEDGVRSGILSMDDIRKAPIVADIMEEYNIELTQGMESLAYEVRTQIIRRMVGRLIEDVCRQSRKSIRQYVEEYQPDYSCQEKCVNKKCVMFSQELEKKQDQLSNEITERVILSQSISTADSKAEYIIKHLFEAYYEHPKQLPDYVLKKYCSHKGIRFNRKDINDNDLKKDNNFKRTISDHIAGMTDQYAAREYFRLYIPEYK